MNNHKQIRRILSNCPSCHIDIFAASYRHTHRIISTCLPHNVSMSVASWKSLFRLQITSI